MYYRALNKHTNKWFYGGIYPDGSFFGFANPRIDENTKCQFTTKKDLKGIDIYTNDIVKVKVEEGLFVKDFIGIIEFFEGTFYIKKEDKPFGQSRTPLFSKSHNIEIIGNIFQNDNLFKPVVSE